MLKKNLSGETVDCACCPDSDRVVPEVGYSICKRTGIVPLSHDVILKKRAEYKRLKAASEGTQKEAYDARQTALKWILVTSFGYLGFNNSKFGRIDAHIAVCAYDRQILKQATRVAERSRFRVLHGIVDSLWVKKPSAEKGDYLHLKDDVEKATGFDISFAPACFFDGILSTIFGRIHLITIYMNQTAHMIQFFSQKLPIYKIIAIPSSCRQVSRCKSYRLCMHAENPE